MYNTYYYSMLAHISIHMMETMLFFSIDAVGSMMFEIMIVMVIGRP